MSILSGLYVVFEGMDGVGKTTTMEAVAGEVERRLQQNVIRTHHPGSTPLGKHIRQLVKHPATIDPNITIDDLSRQMLYLVDQISFTKTLLEPALDFKQIVFGDRHSSISSLVYSQADQIDLKDIDRLQSIVQQPKIDRMYVLTCPWDVCKERISSGLQSRKLDHYDNKSNAFHQRLAGLYNDLVTGPPEFVAIVSRLIALDDIIYIDSTMPPDELMMTVADDVIRVHKERCVSSFSE